MNEVVFAVYHYKNEQPEQLAPLGDTGATPVQPMPPRYFVQDAGLYDIGGTVFPLEKEGLYVFTFADGGQRRYCLYKEDVQALAASLLWCCDFSGKILPIGQYDILNLRLLTNNIEEFWPSSLVAITLLEEKISWRGMTIYSVQEKKTAFMWLEVWDEQAGSWLLYWPELNICLGQTSSERTCFDVFEELRRGEFNYEQIAGAKKLRHKIFTDAGSQALAEALPDRQKTAALIEKENLVPLFGEKMNDVKLYTQENYRKSFPVGQDSISGLAGAESFVFGLLFAAETMVREKFYGPQVRILRNMIKRVK